MPRLRDYSRYWCCAAHDDMMPDDTDAALTMRIITMMLIFAFWCFVDIAWWLLRLFFFLLFDVCYCWWFAAYFTIFRAYVWCCRFWRWYLMPLIIDAPAYDIDAADIDVCYVCWYCLATLDAFTLRLLFADDVWYLLFRRYRFSFFWLFISLLFWCHFDVVFCLFIRDDIIMMISLFDCRFRFFFMRDRGHAFARKMMFALYAMILLLLLMFDDDVFDSFDAFTSIFMLAFISMPFYFPLMLCRYDAVSLRRSLRYFFFDSYAVICRYAMFRWLLLMIRLMPPCLMLMPFSPIITPLIICLMLILIYYADADIVPCFFFFVFTLMIFAAAHDCWYVTLRMSFSDIRVRWKREELSCFASQRVLREIARGAARGKRGGRWRRVMRMRKRACMITDHHRLSILPSSLSFYHHHFPSADFSIITFSLFSRERCRYAMLSRLFIIFFRCRLIFLYAIDAGACFSIYFISPHDADYFDIFAFHYYALDVDIFTMPYWLFDIILIISFCWAHDYDDAFTFFDIIRFFFSLIFHISITLMLFFLFFISLLLFFDYLLMIISCPDDYRLLLLFYADFDFFFLFRERLFSDWYMIIDDMMNDAVICPLIFFADVTRLLFFYAAWWCHAILWYFSDFHYFDMLPFSLILRAMIDVDDDAALFFMRCWSPRCCRHYADIAAR